MLLLVQAESSEWSPALVLVAVGMILFFLWGLREIVRQQQDNGPEPPPLSEDEKRALISDLMERAGGDGGAAYRAYSVLQEIRRSAYRMAIASPTERSSTIERELKRMEARGVPTGNEGFDEQLRMSVAEFRQSADLVVETGSWADATLKRVAKIAAEQDRETERD